MSKAESQKPICPKILCSPTGVTVVGMVVNILLSLAKAIAGIACGSSALLADGIHSAGDMVSDIAVLAALGPSQKRPDETHPYGHRRIQTLASLAIALLVLFAGIGVGINAVKNLLAGSQSSYGITPLLIAISSIIAKEILYHLTVTVGKRTQNPALLANAWHHRSDAFSSLAASIGIAAVAIGKEKWAFMDSATAIALAGILAAMGIKLCVAAAQELIDAAPERAVIDSISHIIAETDGVRSFHAFRIRQSAGKLDMDVHIVVDAMLTVGQGHDIATEVQQRILTANPNVISAIIHIEPSEDF